MAAPVFRIIRELLELDEQTAADVLHLDKRSYIAKEQGNDHFSWSEIVALYNWFRPQIQLQPSHKQERIQMFVEYFPAELKDNGYKQKAFSDSDLPENIISTIKIMVPESFMELQNQDALVDYSGAINEVVAHKVKSGDFFSSFPSFHFWAVVWWNDKLGYWAMQVSQLNAYRETLLCESLDDLIAAAMSRYR